MNKCQQTLDKAISFKLNKDYENYNLILAKLVVEFPENALVNYHYACSFDLLSLETKAIPYYETAINLGLDGIDLADAFIGVGSSYRAIGNYEKAKYVFENAIKLFPNDNTIKLFYTMTLHNLNMHEEAFKFLSAIILETTADKRILEYKTAIGFYSNNINKIY